MTEDEIKLLEFRFNVMQTKMAQIRNLIPDVSVIQLDKAFATLREIRKIIDG